MPGVFEGRWRRCHPKRHALRPLSLLDQVMPAERRSTQVFGQCGPQLLDSLFVSLEEPKRSYLLHAKQSGFPQFRQVMRNGGLRQPTLAGDFAHADAKVLDVRLIWKMHERFFEPSKDIAPGDMGNCPHAGIKFQPVSR